MRSYDLNAIIIRAKDFGEADRLLTLYSLEEGKLGVKAKGVRKIKSKLGGHLDLLNISRLNLVKGKTIDIIVGAKLLEAHSKLKKDLKKISLGFYFAELLYKLTSEREKHEEIFQLTKNSLYVLEKLKSDKNCDTLKVVFEYKLLGLLGHNPRLDVCVNCKKDHKDKIYFDFEHGGVICEDCKKENSFEYEKITLSEVKLLNAFDKIDVKDIFKVKGIDKNITGISGIIKKFNLYIFDKIYKSENFYKELKS